MGLSVTCRRGFPDHHPYTEQDHQELLRLLSVSDYAVTTEKDAVKISRFPWPPHKILVVRLVDLHFPLRNHEKQPVFFHCFIERRERFWPPDKKRGDHPREDHDTA